MAVVGFWRGHRHCGREELLDDGAGMPWAVNIAR